MSKQEKQKKYDYWVCRICNNLGKEGLCPCNGVIDRVEEKTKYANQTIHGPKSTKKNNRDA